MKVKMIVALIFLTGAILTLMFFINNAPVGAVTATATTPAEDVRIVVSGAADVDAYRRNPSEYIKNALTKMGYKPDTVEVKRNKSYGGPGITKITIRCRCCSWCKNPRTGDWFCCEWCCEEE